MPNTTTGTTGRARIIRYLTSDPGPISGLADPDLDADDVAELQPVLAALLTALHEQPEPIVFDAQIADMGAGSRLVLWLDDDEIASGEGWLCVATPRQTAVATGGSSRCWSISVQGTMPDRFGRTGRDTDEPYAELGNVPTRRVPALLVPMVLAVVHAERARRGLDA